MSLKYIMAVMSGRPSSLVLQILYDLFVYRSDTDDSQTLLTEPSLSMTPSQPCCKVRETGDYVRQFLSDSFVFILRLNIGQCVSGY